MKALAWLRPPAPPGRGWRGCSWGGGCGEQRRQGRAGTHQCGSQVRRRGRRPLPGGDLRNVAGSADAHFPAAQLPDHGDSGQGWEPGQGTQLAEVLGRTGVRSPASERQPPTHQGRAVQPRRWLQQSRLRSPKTGPREASPGRPRKDVPARRAGFSRSQAPEPWRSRGRCVVSTSGSRSAAQVQVAPGDPGRPWG